MCFARYASDIVETLCEPLLLLDGEFGIRPANRAFRMSPAETEGQCLFTLVDAQWIHRGFASSSRPFFRRTDVLTLARFTSRPPAHQRVALGPLIRDMVDDLELAITGTGGEIDVGPMPEIRADPSHLRQLFANLFGNALKYRRSDVPPRITIRATTARCENGIAQHEIVVRDTGIGFDPGSADLIF